MSPAQMLFTHVVSDAPVPTICQALQSPQTNLNKANRSKSVPKEVCDSSTCVSPGFTSLSLAPDKESDLWQNKNDLSAPGRLGLSKESDSRNTHLLSPGDGDSRVDGREFQLITVFMILHLHIFTLSFPFGLINIINDKKNGNQTDIFHFYMFCNIQILVFVETAVYLLMLMLNLSLSRDSFLFIPLHHYTVREPLHTRGS